MCKEGKFQNKCFKIIGILFLSPFYRCDDFACCFLFAMFIIVNPIVRNSYFLHLFKIRENWNFSASFFRTFTKDDCLCEPGLTTRTQFVLSLKRKEKNNKNQTLVCRNRIKEGRILPSISQPWKCNRINYVLKESSKVQVMAAKLQRNIRLYELKFTSSVVGSINKEILSNFVCSDFNLAHWSAFICEATKPSEAPL